MVLTLLRGLSGKFRHMVSILKMHRPFLSFAEARTHLLLEEMELDARPPSPPSALLAATRPAGPAPPTAPRTGQQAPPTRPLVLPPTASATAAAVAAVAGAANSHQQVACPLAHTAALLPVLMAAPHLVCNLPSCTRGLARCRCGPMDAHFRLR
jgi:hypothetical protein